MACKQIAFYLLISCPLILIRRYYFNQNVFHENDYYYGQLRSRRYCISTVKPMIIIINYLNPVDDDGHATCYMHHAPLADTSFK